MWINHDDYIEAVEKNSGPLNRIAGFQETIAVQLKTIMEGQDKLLQSHAGLEKHLEFSGGAGHTQYMKLTEGLDSLRDFVHTQVSHSQHSIEDFQDKYHAEVSSALVALDERLANIEVAFTVRLEALENRLERWEQWELAVIDKPSQPRRPNGKHPAGKRK